MRRLAIVLLACGCAPKAAPATEPATPAENEASTSPREVEFAYRSSAGDEDAQHDGDDEATPPTEPAKEQPPALPEPTELSAIAERAVLDAMTEHPSVLLTPALPLEWPPKPGEVVYIAYPIEPLASGVTKWRVGRPIARVAVKLADKSASVEKLEVKNKKPLGTFENPRQSATDPIHTAEGTLFTIVAGQGDAEKVRHRLRPYLDWIDAHPVVRADVRERASAFVTWLSAK